MWKLANTPPTWYMAFWGLFMVPGIFFAVTGGIIAAVALMRRWGWM